MDIKLIYAYKLEKEEEKLLERRRTKFGTVNVYTEKNYRKHVQ